MPTQPTPGRSLVTRRAVVDLVRAATVGSYGVTGFAAGPLERLLGRIGLAQPGIAVHLGDALDIELRPDDRVRRPGRRGRPPGRFCRPLFAPASAPSRGGAADDPHRRAALRAGWGTTDRGPPAGRRGRAARPRRQRHGRGLMARRACDGDGLLGAFRAAVMNLEAHVDEINALNVYPVPDGDTGSNMLATVRGRPDRGGGRGRPARRADRRGHQLRGADGCPRQLRRHHQPDLPRHGRGARRQEPVQRPRPRPRARRRAHGPPTARSPSRSRARS